MALSQPPGSWSGPWAQDRSLRPPEDVKALGGRGVPLIGGGAGTSEHPLLIVTLGFLLCEGTGNPGG